ncbi:MAG: hypothetical protein M0P69_01510 [Bacteroidales bacterium]|nr:hypothetical protein [Bacteroidales bacterium]
MMETISVEELDRLESAQGKVTPVSSGVTPEVADRLSTVSMVDRDNPDKETVRHKNMATFLGEKLMTPTYRRQRERLAQDTAGSMYAKPEMGIIDTVGEFLRDVGHAWYEKTDTAIRDRQAQAEAEEKIDVPKTVLGSIGYQAKEGEFSPLAERLVQYFNIENETEKKGLNTLLNHNEGRTLTDLRDMVAESLDLVNPDRQTSPTIFGDREYDPIDVPNLIAESLLASGVGSFISGEEGISVASSAFNTLVDIVQRTGGLGREEALELTGEWVSQATVMVSRNAAEIGEFTTDDLVNAQRRSDPRGIVMKPIDNVLTNEHYQSGITYALARGAAYAESSIMNRIGTSVQLLKEGGWRFEGLDNVVLHPVQRELMDNVVKKVISGFPDGLLTYKDAEALDRLIAELNPSTGSWAKFTPGVEETRAFRSLEARKKGLGASVANEVAEASFDLFCFLTEMSVVRGIAMKTPLGAYISGKPGMSARMAERYMRTAPGELTHLTADKVLRMTTVANTLRNAAFTGVNRALSTAGTFKDKMVAGGLTFLYTSTPATTGMALHKVGYTADNVLVPIAVDFLSNTIITTGVSYVPMYNEFGGFTDDFIVNASVQMMLDLGMSLSTRAFLRSDKVTESVITRDREAYRRAVALKNETVAKVSEDEYVSIKAKQRAKLESVQEVIDQWQEKVAREAKGKRAVPGTPDVNTDDIEVRGYRDPEVSRFRKREMKDAQRMGELYKQLSALIDKRSALTDEINRLEQDAQGAKGKVEGGVEAKDPKIAELEKQITTIQGQETKIRNELDVLERKGIPDATEKPEPTPEGESQERIDSRARQRLLATHKELNDLVKQEKALNDEIEKKVAEGKSARSLEKKQDDLLNKIRNLQIEQEAMMFTEGTPREVTLEQFERAQLDSIEKQIKQFKAGLKAGEQLTRKDIRAFQSYVQSVVKLATGLTPKQKLALTRMASKVGNKEQLDKTLSEIWMKTDELKKENEKELFIKASDRLLEKAKKKIESKGFDPATAVLFREAIKLRKNQATEHTSFGQSALEMALYDITMLNRSHDITAEQARAVYNDLEAIYNNGAATKEGMKQREKARNETLIKSALADIQGDGPELVGGTDAQVKEGRKGTSLARKIILGSQRWGSLMIGLANRSSDPKGTSFIERFTDMFAAERHAQIVRKNYTDDKMDMFGRIFGTKNKNEVHDKVTKDLQDMVKITVDMVVKDPGSKEETIHPKSDEISRTVARQRWMEWQQPEGKKRLQKRSGYTEKTMEQIEDFLTAQDYDLMRELRIAYDRMYADVNVVYREVQGVDLPYRANYSPFVPMRMSDKEVELNVLEQLHVDAGKKVTVGGKSFLKEIGDISRLDTIGDVFLYDRYVADMSHYIGFAKTLKDVNTIFNDSRIQEAIVRRDGQKVLDTIRVHINTLSRGKLEASLNGLFSGVHRYISRWYIATLGLDAKRIAIQLLSAGLYLTEMSGKEFVTGMLDLPRAYATGEIEVITKNPYMLDRGVNPTRDMKMALDAIAEQQSVFQRKFIDNPRLNDIAMVMLKAGDRGAIIMGAWGLYKHYTEKMGLQGADALDKVLRFVNDSQQSKDLSQMSAILMDGSPLVRAFTMYVHTPQQYLNNLWDALVSRGRMGNGQLAKTIVAYMGMSLSYSVIQNAGKISLTSATVSLLAGPVANGIPFIRDVVPPIVAAVFAQIYGEKQGASFSYSPIQNFSQDVVSVINTAMEMAEYGVDADTTIDLARSLGEMSAPFTGALGAGIKATSNVAKGIQHYVDYDDIGYMLMKFAGYTDSQLKD